MGWVGAGLDLEPRTVHPGFHQQLAQRAARIEGSPVRAPAPSPALLSPLSAARRRWQSVGSSRFASTESQTVNQSISLKVLKAHVCLYYNHSTTPCRRVCPNAAIFCA